MATALDVFDALEEATAELEPGSEFALNTEDRLLLLDLTVADLKSRHMGKNRIDEVLHGLSTQDLEPLSGTLGVKLSVTDDAPRLIQS
jgi:hypothetical protein